MMVASRLGVVSLVVVLAVVLLSGCTPSGATGPAPTAAAAGASQGGIEISDAWARAPGGAAQSPMGTAPAAAHATPAPMGATPAPAHANPAPMSQAGGGNGAAYMLIRNTGSEGDRVVAAQSDVASAVELHTTIEEGGVARMRPLDAIDVPARGEALLAPAGMHIMLIGLTQALSPGDTIELTLQFERAGPIRLQVPVRQP
jgi:periplasmic copper chaperone A